MQKQKQQVLSAPKKIFVKEYTTKSGQVKNKYKLNTLAKQIKEIKHIKPKVTS